MLLPPSRFLDFTQTKVMHSSFYGALLNKVAKYILFYCFDPTHCIQFLVQLIKIDGLAFQKDMYE